MNSSLNTIGAVIVIGIISSKKGSMNKDDEITVLRVEKRRAGWKPERYMRSLGRGKLHDPNQVTGAYVTLEGTDPQKLRNYRSVENILRKEAQKMRIFNPHLLFMNVYQSRRKAGKWEAKWELRG